MKKTLLSISILILISVGVNAQNVNIPDANFKAYLVGNTAINTNSDTEIQLSEANVFSGTINCPFANISDLTGIEQFTNLTELNCHNNNLTTLSLSQNTLLTKLYCMDNSLGTIDVTQNTALTELIVTNTNLTTLDVTQNTALEFLSCGANSLSSIDVTQNTALKVLSVSSNNLNNLNISQNTSLEELFCFINNLSSLDISQNTALVQVVCANNSLTVLNMKNISTSTLTFINATNNPDLTCIEVDDVAAATANWTQIDPASSFSLDCNYPLGVDEVELTQRISVYPNPAEFQIYINSDVIIKSVNIIDLFGKIIQSNITSTNTIDVSKLSNGVYLLQIETDKGLVGKKFIKE